MENILHILLFIYINKNIADTTCAYIGFYLMSHLMFDN